MDTSSAVSESAARRPPFRAASRPWLWPLAWLAVAAATAVMVRLPGPAMLDPDEHAAALYFDRIVHGQRLEEPLLSTPKPLLTVVDGAAWALAHDWRVLTALAVLAFALAVTALARVAGRLAGPAGALAVTVALLGSGALVAQVARGNSVIWALAGWALAADALTRPRRRWGLAAAALLLAALARAETWLLLPPAALLGLVAAWCWRDRRALLLLLPLLAPLVWLGHDLALSGDALYSLRVPERYTELISGRHVVAPADWLATVGRRYGDAPLLAALALVGAAWLASRRAWLLLGGLGVVVAGVLALFGVEAWRGTYVSFRYFDPPDTGVRVLAALGAAWIGIALGEVVKRWGSVEVARGVGAGVGRAGAPAVAVARAAARGVGAAVAVGLAVAACWPLAPFDREVRSTVEAGARSSRNAAAAVRALRPVARTPGAVVVVSGPQRTRIALDLGLPLERVRDSFLATLHQPLDRALAGSAAVFHDAATDGPALDPLSVTGPTKVGRGRDGGVEVAPILTDPERGLYVLSVEPG